MSALPAPPVRLMVVDREREPIAEWLRERIPGLEVRTSERAALTESDLEWADAYMGFRPPPHLKLDPVSWVHCTGAGVDAYLFRRHFPATTLLTRTDEPFGAQIGEWCLARALAVTQDLLPLYDAQRRREWAQRYLRELKGMQVLIVGTGEVGRGVARVFLGLGCRVTGVSQSGAAVAPFESVSPVSRLRESAAGADLLIVALPLTEATWHLVDASVLAACRGAILLNVGRGPLVDEASIIPALDAGHLRAAALDVFEEEPLPTTSPLWADARVIISPHIAGMTTVAGAGGSFLSTYQALQRGEHPPLAVDTERGY
jgi:D-2-hydroxyacid dehydrogenase (NADP+)